MSRPIVIPIASPLARHLETLPSSDDPRAPIHPKAHAVMVAHGRAALLSNQFAGILADAGLRPPLPSFRVPRVLVSRYISCHLRGPESWLILFRPYPGAETAIPV